MTRDLDCRVVAPEGLSAAEWDAWERLCRSHTFLASPFLSPSYARAVASCRSHVYVAVILDRERPCGFLPFQYRNACYKILGAAERVGGEMTDYFGLVAEPGLSLDAPALLRLAGLNHLYFTHLDESQLTYGLDGSAPEPGLRIRLEPHGIAYREQLRQRNRKLMEDTQRRERQLERACGPLRFVFAEPRHEGPLDRLIAQKRLQYGRTGASDALAEEWKRRLLRQLAAQPSDGCRAILSSLYAGDTWVASHLGLCGRSLLHYWFPVYNPELSRYAPGRLLLLRVIEAAERVEIFTIDRGAGDTPAKRELANDRHVYYRGAWRRPSLGALVSRCTYALQWRCNQIRLSA